MTLRWTHLREEDTEAWSQLTRLTAKADRHEEYFTAEQLREALTKPGFNPELDTWAVWDGDALVAVGSVGVQDQKRFDGRVQTNASGRVHPDWRRQGIGTEILRRSEERISELAQQRHPGEPFVFTSDGGDEKDPNRILLERAGYRLVRHFQDMQRRIQPGDTVPDLSLREDGVAIRAPREDDYEEIRVAHNDAFRDHWGSWPESPIEWQNMVTDGTFRPEFSRIAVEADGQVLAYALTGQWDAGELYVLLVGTRREARGRGLGKAVISEVVRSAITDGSITRVDLDVDSINPSDANKLYDSLGFEIKRTWGTYEKDPKQG